MANRNQGRGGPEPSVMPQSGVPTTPEPPVRRWPHPVEGTEPVQMTDPALHFIHCALSYQNQLLADIKTLLEELVEQGEGEEAEEKE